MLSDTDLLHLEADLLESVDVLLDVVEMRILLCVSNGRRLLDVEQVFLLSPLTLLLSLQRQRARCVLR